MPCAVDLQAGRTEREVDHVLGGHGLRLETQLANGGLESSPQGAEPIAQRAGHLAVGSWVNARFHGLFDEVGQQF